jgi:hypothetical protein
MKSLYVIGSSIAIGSVWFFSIYALLTQGIGVEPTELQSTALLAACLVIGAVVGYKIFIAPSRNSK